MLRIDGVERVTEERLAAIDKALTLRAREIDAHLQALNGEAERLRQMQATYLPREVADQQHKEAMSAISALQQFRAGEMGRQAIINLLSSAAISAIIGAVFLYLRTR